MFGAQAISRLFHRASNADAPNSLIEALVKKGYIASDIAKNFHNKTNAQIEQELLVNKICTREQITEAYSLYFDLPYVKLREMKLEPATLNMIPEAVAKQYQVIAYELKDKSLHIAVGLADRLQSRAPEVLVELKKMKGIDIHLAVTTPEDIYWALSQYHLPEPPPISSSARVRPLSQIPSTAAKETPAILGSVPSVDLLSFNIPLSVLAKFPKEVAEKYRMVVFGLEPPLTVSPVPKKIKVALQDPANPQVKDILDFIKKRNMIEIEQYLATKEGINKALEGYQKLMPETKKEALPPSPTPPSTPPPPVVPKIETKEKLPSEGAKIPSVISPPAAKEFPKTPIMPPVVQRPPIEKEAPPELKQPPKPVTSKPQATAPIFKPTPPTMSRPTTPASHISTSTVPMTQAPKIVIFSKQAPPPIPSPPPPQPPPPPQAAPQRPPAPPQPAPPVAPQPASKPPAPPAQAEQKVGEMKAIASTVIKPTEKRIKEGMPHPYTPPPIKAVAAPQGEAVPEILPEDIKVKEGFMGEGAVRQEEGLEESNLDKFLAKPVLSVEDLERTIRVGMVPEIIAAMVSLAVAMRASDIHLEASEKNVRLRYRIDGILKDIIKLPLSLHAPLVSRVKILSKLKIDEQRIPQDGRFDVIVHQHQIDLRISTLPTVHGEKVVARILDKSAGVLSLEEIGLTGRGFDILLKNIAKPYGVILATGPTGSGKSTTLYGILQRISTPGVNVITLEDPVEYEIPGINQTQVKPQIGFTFADGLRSVLRQDPNIIMVGEIRDLETAAMATHAALTGHLVLSTLHTNDAAGALPRLINMGVEPFLITSSINAIIAQRLVRKLCQDCKEPIHLPEALMKELKEELSKIKDAKIANMETKDLIFYRGKGCANCTNGYHGRIGVFEVLGMSDRIEDLAVEKAPSNVIAEQAIKDGMITMKQDGIIKALKGITTVDEVIRVTTSI